MEIIVLVGLLLVIFVLVAYVAHLLDRISDLELDRMKYRLAWERAIFERTVEEEG